MGRRVPREIYLDYQASTPCDPAVVEAMLPYLVYDAANPASPHRAGTKAQRAVGEARELVAEALGSFPEEIVFTSGATESNNLAIRGSTVLNGKRRRLITTAIEHKSVLGPMQLLSTSGWELSICPVKPDGRIDLAALANLLNDSVALVSVQAANNEIGTIQPLAEIGQLVHGVGGVFHVDAAQAFGRIPMDVDDFEIDLLSVSGHKCYGPKGIGALYVRGGSKSELVQPQVVGGGQERGIRSGTLNVPGIVGLGEAVRLCVEGMPGESARCAALRDRMESKILKHVTGTRRNGAMERRLPHASSLTFSLAEAEAVIANAPELMLSASSACSAGAPEPSHVLQALGLKASEAYRTIRFSVGRFTTLNDAESAASRIVEVATRVSSACQEALHRLEVDRSPLAMQSALGGSR